MLSDMITSSSHILLVSRKLHPFRLSSSSSKPKLVLRSTSNNIYRNLALEDWFYQNHKFSSSQILYFYRNTPCVVIGRHQNPWTEANVPFLRRHSIDLGGDTTLHWGLEDLSKLVHFQLGVTVGVGQCTMTWATSTSPSWPPRRSTTGSATWSSSAPPSGAS